ncbi:NUDIX domain-containing protein [Sinirhodobacter populi]|uniref:NUDIX domain-containing protein n=1 Tax=Paenirhodobacter populi TaxID=2306993 RepID=A0A443KGL4_9RHOB|nr:NUDIX domain-containing protein [Sinirhodobacter populi]RWR31893.1 NUDIX domain-containing protein [Sinirhodobacter populi]
MTIWRPASAIRLKALGLHWRGDRLLAAEVLDDAGRVKGVRPLGGTVEFGETAEAAVIREFREELGITVQPLGPPVFMENLYIHEGRQGHEILAVFDVAFPPGAFADMTRIAFSEDDGTACAAEWFALDRLDLPGGPQLYPAGLKAHLLKTG